MDRRFAVGTHHCKHPIRGKVPRVALVADFYFDRRKWEAEQDRKAMKAAYEKMQRGSKCTKDEIALAARWRARIGIITNEEARRAAGG